MLSEKQSMPALSAPLKQRRKCVRRKAGCDDPDAVLAWPLVRHGGLVTFDDYRYVTRWQREIECPKMAIDPFVQCLADRCQVIHNEWQLILRKK
jgi:hypothetical protein